MTDTELVHQVEQAMLGAMITRPLRVGGLPGAVTPDLFADERHQAIAAALTGTAGEERGLLGRLRGFFARFSRRTRENRAYLESLPDLCPDATHMDGYFQILAEARDQRDARTRAAMTQAADAAQVLAGAAGQLAVQTAGTGRAVAPGELPASIARQARALAGYAQQFAQAASAQQGQPGPAAPAQPGQPAARRALAPQAASGRAAVPAQAGQTADGRVPPAPRAQQIQRQPVPAPQAGGAAAPESPRAASAPARITRLEAQDLLLAALMRDPALAREMVSSLPATLFEEGPRRELYTTIGEFVTHRRPLDPLLVAWVADQRSAAGPDGIRDGWLSPDYIRGIASLPPVPARPAWLAQMLLSGDGDAPRTATPDQADHRPETATTPEPQQETEADPGQQPAQAQAEQAPYRRPVFNIEWDKPAPEPAQLIETPPPDPEQGGMTPRM